MSVLLGYFFCWAFRKFDHGYQILINLATEPLELLPRREVSILLIFAFEHDFNSNDDMCEKNEHPSGHTYHHHRAKTSLRRTIKIEDVP
ncbi:Uncharacterized protein TPS_09144 [Trichinella pseudospiralis]